MSLRVFALQLLFALLPLVASASDVSLRLDVRSTDDEVNVTVTNVGLDPALDVRATAELLDVPGAHGEEIFRNRSIAPGTSSAGKSRIPLPALAGTYVLKTVVSYLQDGRTLSVVNAAPFHVARGLSLAGECPKIHVRMREAKRVRIPPSAGVVALVLPDEVRGEVLAGGTELALTSAAARFNVSSDFFIVRQETTDEGHASLICPARLTRSSSPAAFSHFSSAALRWLLLVSFGLAIAGFIRHERKGTSEPSFDFLFARCSFTVFCVTGTLLASRALGIIPESSLEAIDAFEPRVGPYVSAAARSVLEFFYFRGIDYDHFFRFIADPLLVYLVFINPFVVAHAIRPLPETDKWWSLLRAALAPFVGTTHWDKSAKIALLAFCVKLLYVPLLWSWTVNNVIHQANLTARLDMSFLRVNEWLVAALILVDVGIFALSYLIELPRLGNSIRSVEPTIFGWLVCLVCYPPLNQLVFQLIDRPFLLSFPRFGGAAGIVAEIFVTVLWGVYVSATIALGLKSSNLTNRGIVARGPYAFVRHPAYAAKLALWIVSALALGTMHVVLVAVLCVIYFLRAWTEERHLSADEEYRSYCERVRCRFIPGVW